MSDAREKIARRFLWTQRLRFSTINERIPDMDPKIL